MALVTAIAEFTPEFSFQYGRLYLAALCNLGIPARDAFGCSATSPAIESDGQECPCYGVTKERQEYAAKKVSEFDSRGTDHVSAGSSPFSFCRSSGALHNLNYGNLRLSQQAACRRCSAANRRFEKPGIFEMPGF